MPMRTETIEDDPRWARVLGRDKEADGTFFYSVATTGVFCKPSCPSRAANPRNVRFHATLADCRASGFRPCKRCRPEQGGADAVVADRVKRVCGMIEAAEEPPSLAEMAKVAGVSAHHFHRMFKAATGVTPGGYVAARRAARVRDALATSRTVTAAIHDAGFNSSGRFYEASDALLGMTPTDLRAGGRDTEIRFAVAECSLGAILVARTAKGICEIALGNEPEPLVRALQDHFPRAELIGADAAFERLVAQVIGLVERPAAAPDLPLDVRGTAFQRRVWEALVKVPPGSTASYAEVARRVGAPGSARAVAGACAANRLAVVIPCHRVVREDGALSGYRWGVERKRALLEREGGDA